MIECKNANDIIARLGYYRNKRNLSAREVSLRMGKSESWYYRIESGEIDLKLSTIIELAELLEINLSQLFYYDIEKYEEDKELLLLIQNMSKQEKDALCNFIKIKK